MVAGISPSVKTFCVHYAVTLCFNCGRKQKKLNPAKTELTVLGLQSLLENLNLLLPSQILQQSYQTVGVVCNLSVMFDSELTLQHQVASVYKSCFTGPQDLREGYSVTNNSYVYGSCLN